MAQVCGNDIVWFFNLCETLQHACICLTIPQTRGTSVATILTGTNENQFQKEGGGGLRRKTSNEIETPQHESRPGLH